MSSLQPLRRQRPLGSLEKISAACHHAGFFNNVGFSVHYTFSSTEQAPLADLRRLIYGAVAVALRKYPILFAVPVAEETPETYFASLQAVDLSKSILFVQRANSLASHDDGVDNDLDTVLRDQHNTSFKQEQVDLPFWRLIVLTSPGRKDEFTASFIYHHAIGDGVSGINFHTAFLEGLKAIYRSDQLTRETKEIVVAVEDSPIPKALEELHPLPLDPKSTLQPNTGLRQWTGNSICSTARDEWLSFQLSPSISKAFFEDCKVRSLSVTCAMVSIASVALFQVLPSDAEAVTCIIPINLRPWLSVTPRDTMDKAIGTYFDATKVLLEKPEDGPVVMSQTDIWSRSQQVSAAIQRYLSNVSPTGEPYTAVAQFKELADTLSILKSMESQPRDAGLEVTNVGRLTGQTDVVHGVWQPGKALLSRSAAATGAALTVTVATGGDGSLSVGFSWQQGVVEDVVAKRFREEVRNYFDRYT